MTNVKDGLHIHDRGTNHHCVSHSKQDSIRHRKVSKQILVDDCFECTSFVPISTRIQGTCADDFHTTTQVRPQGCHARENGYRQLLKPVAAKVQ